MELKDSKTLTNLMNAFTGESMATNKYIYYGEIAKREGFQQISELFQETSDNERAHAKIWFELINAPGNTAQNLLSAAEGEHYEWTQMYADYAKVAREEGFELIAKLFENVAKIENTHENRYRRLLANVRQNQVFSKPQAQVWVCGNCGFVYEGTQAPVTCPVCRMPQAFFRLQEQNY